MVSLCAGKGLDLLGVLSSHPARQLVRGRLVELDSDLAAAARGVVETAGLSKLEVVVADAGLTDSYVGAAPADRDVEATVRAMPSLCSQGGAVIWTRHRHEPDLTPAIRRWFADAGFAEQAFTSPGIDSFAVGVHRLNGPGVTLSAGRQLFTFTH